MGQVDEILSLKQRGTLLSVLDLNNLNTQKVPTGPFKMSLLFQHVKRSV